MCTPFYFSKIELLDQNATGQLNQTELDQPLAQQTVSNILKNAETLYSNINVVKNGKSLKTTRYPQLDEVVKFVADMNNNNLPVNRDSILRYRIGVKCRPMHGESASVDIPSENIQNELRKIEELLGPYDPANIMNFDEAGLYYQQSPRRTICSESLGDLKKTRANLLSMTAIGKKHEIEYHYSTNAWMTTYVKKLNVAFGRQNRKIALLLDNASVHKIRIPLNNIKLIFLLSNTTSKLHALDTGIIDNFKAHFRAQQYDRALCLYISKKLDNPNVYKMDQYQAMFFLANAWLKVKPETINGMLPDLPRNFDNKVIDVIQLNLEADKSEMIETILMYKFSLDDLDRKLHRQIRMRLADTCAELSQKSKQFDLIHKSGYCTTKWDGVAFAIKDKKITPVLVEFSGGVKFNTTDKKEQDDETKIVGNILHILKYIEALQTVNYPIPQHYIRFFGNNFLNEYSSMHRHTKFPFLLGSTHSVNK
ncbi:hypothetical protein RO3G_10581 [Rhizopus delemar RA 99-880]|uniref:DDE-1 domain-containing protein n=1 Tax=Rhizopus delemar (strain RA 99-880 / ATCC MYA-4621 / FGSC 9543 / NRRL 43880) TaxID=246409 RepID=I1CBP1_RHIO9|nr:hypothetical protein RO3G_10581 [Rhizopus delemar RA 99-880]|eukprot:EIE85871.1 hypothetical protein RO3G_10581 [Rhizopus delemar RA 99-880]